MSISTESITTEQLPAEPATWSPPEFRPRSEQPRPTVPNGAAAATLLACGIGCAFFGMVVLLNEASPWLHERLTLSHAVGPLSGKSAVGVAGWLLAWAGLHRRLAGRDVPMARVVRATRILIAASFVLTFPPVFMFFAAD